MTKQVCKQNVKSHNTYGVPMVDAKVGSKSKETFWRPLLHVLSLAASSITAPLMPSGKTHKNFWGLKSLYSQKSKKVHQEKPNW